MAIIQIREGLLNVLSAYIERGSLTTAEAVKIVQDILFYTANKLYGLNLPFVPVTSAAALTVSPPDAWTNNFVQLQRFLEQKPSVEFLRLQWLDYTNTLRLRILPIKQALHIFREGQSFGVVEAVLGLLQPDVICPGFSATHEYTVYPQFSGKSASGLVCKLVKTKRSLRYSQQVSVWGAVKSTQPFSANSNG